MEAALRVCVCKLMSGALLFPSVVTHSVTAVGLCCCCLLVFTELVVTLFLLSVWLMEFWTRPFSVSSDEVALRFLLFLCELYGVVLLLTPPLMAVEMLVKMLRTLDDQTSESLSAIVGVLGCFVAWLVSAIYCSHDWTLERVFVQNCLDEGGCLVYCLPDDNEMSWIVPAAMLVLVGLMKASRAAPEHTLKESVVPRCLSPHAGFVHCELRHFSPGNDVLRAHQTGSTGDHVLKQTPSGSRSALLRMERCAFKSHERESPVPGRDASSCLLCVLLLCVFPTLLSCNVLLIFNLENVVVFTLRLLSLSVNSVPDL